MHDIVLCEKIFIMDFIFFAISFVLLIVVYNSKRLDVLSKRMLLLFLSIWVADLALSPLGLYELYPPSMYTLFLLTTNVIMFTFGFCIVKSNINNREFSKEDVNGMVEHLYNSPLFIILLLISTIITLFLLSTSYAMLAYYGNLGDVRSDYYGGSLFGDSFILVDNILLSPIDTLCVPVFSYMLFYKRDWKMFLMALFILSHASLSGGRFGYVRILIGIVFVAFCLISEKQYIKKRLITFGVALTVSIFLVSMVTALRSGEKTIDKESSMEAMYCYSVAPISAFDYAINNGDYLSRVGGYQYGRLTLSSLESLIYSVFNKMGLHYHQAIEDLIEMKQENYIAVGNHTNWNALYTAVLYFYLDGGALGVVIFPFFIGFLIRWLVIQFHTYRSWPLLILISFFFHSMIFSVFDFNFGNQYTLIMIMILYYVGTRQKQVHPKTL